MTRPLSMLALLTILSIGFVACGGEEDNNTSTEADMASSSDDMGGGPNIPDLTNPVADDAAAIMAGEMLYQQCSGCHGADGTSTALPNINRPMTDAAAQESDGYMYTVIEKGGAGVGISTGMPKYGDSLSMEEIWQVVSYVRTLAPQ